MRRIMLLFTVAATMAAMMALPGAALADDVCVSHEGETIYDSGPSRCSSDPTSQAVAVNGSEASPQIDSEAVAANDSGAISAFGGDAFAYNDSAAFAYNDSEAVAVNHSVAFANADCSATALNGEEESCGIGSFPPF